MDQEQRAKQFLPFSALKGYEKALRAREKVWMPRPQLTEERIQELEERLRQTAQGDWMEVTFYRNGAYRKMRGQVKRLSVEARFLEIEDQKIRFGDLYDLKFLEIYPGAERFL